MGLASGIWGIVVSSFLCIVVSFMTSVPEKKANEFLTYVIQNKGNSEHQKRCK